MNRLPIAYVPEAPAPTRWLQFLNELLYEEDIPALQEYIGYCLLPVTKAQKMLLMVGKGGVTENVLSEAARQLEARELVKGRVLEAALLSAREVCDALCEALGADGVQCVGSKFVIYRRSEKKAQEAARQARELKKRKSNPVRRGAQERRRQAREERERRNEYFRQAAIQAAIERRKSREE